MFGYQIYNNNNLKSFTLNTIEASSQISGDIDVLVAGNNFDNVLKEIASIPKVKKILSFKSEEYENQLPEDLTNLIMSVEDKYDYIIAPATAFGKNLMPRVAALLDVPQISDVIKILGKDGFN